jgi:hypothetical protein
VPWFSHSRQKFAVRCIHSYASSVVSGPRRVSDQLSDTYADSFSRSVVRAAARRPSKPTRSDVFKSSFSCESSVVASAWL